MKKTLWFLFLLGVGYTLMAQSAKDTTNILLNGQNMPSFTVTTMDGGTFSSDELKGKTVLINFFATWCPPCRKEMPHVKSEIYDQYKDRDDFVLMIISREEAPEKVTPYVNNNKFPMTFYSDIDRSCFSLFATQSIPRNYLFNASGKLIYQSTGFNEGEFKNLLTILSQELK